MIICNNNYACNSRLSSIDISDSILRYNKKDLLGIYLKNYKQNTIFIKNSKIFYKRASS